LNIQRARRVSLLFVLAMAGVLSATKGLAAEANSGASGLMNPAVIAPPLPETGPPRDDLDAYGGWTKLKGTKTGFFHVEQLGGRWWFVTPEGNAYFMLQLGGGNDGASLLARSWGFNAFEGTSNLPHTHIAYFFRQLDRPYPVAQMPGFPPWVTLPDVFDPRWPEICRQTAEAALGPIKDDPQVIGYYLDNEICLQGWYEAVTRTAPDAPARAAFVEVAREYYTKRPEELAKDWKDYRVTTVDQLVSIQGDPPVIPGLKDAWVTAFAERAFSVPAQAARAVAPNHLNLGTRMFNAPLPEPGILKAMGANFDVVSMNLYSMFPDRLPTQIFTLVPAIYALTGRPTMTTEFSFRAGDTLHPNRMGAFPAVDSQQDRAVGYLSYVAAVASVPSHIGVSWYKFPDDGLTMPWEGYGENCNFGVTDIEGRPYAVLSQAMRATNNVIYELAADPVRNEKSPLFWRTELLRWDLAADEQIFARLSRTGVPVPDPLARQALTTPRAYDANYWIRHTGPNLIVNDGRFTGWCQANMIERAENLTRLTLINVLAFTSFPRALWLGANCDDPDGPFDLESNARFLAREVTDDGQVRRIIMADGSYIRTGFDRPELRLDRRIPYIDAQFDPATRQLAVTLRGDATRLGVSDVHGWRISCNGTPIAAETLTEVEGLVVLSTVP
jgi:hypothetical protein